MLSFELIYRVYTLLRRMARFAGLSAILRRVLGRQAGLVIYRLAPRSGEVFNIRGHQMVLARDTDYPPADMAMDTYEPQTSRLFESQIKPGMVVVDIGAHVGYFTLLAAKCVGSSGTVYALEPEPNNFALLTSNVERNGYYNVLPVQQAVSNFRGPTNLSVSNLDNGSHSIYINSDRPSSGNIIVQATTLDIFLEELGWPTIDFVKVDVEGGEMAVLEGMNQFFDRSPSAKLVLEFCPFLLQSAGVKPNDLLDKAMSLGYTGYFIQEHEGLIPFGDTNIPDLITQLLKHRTYINLFCTNE